MLFCGFITITCKAQTKTSLTADEFEKAISKDSIQLLDVRTPDEYASGHIKNSLLADWKDKNEFNRRIGYIDKERPVFVYCLGGGRSAAAAEKMRASGYLQVYELVGGMNAWKAGNKAVEGKSNEIQMSVEEFTQSINASKTVLVDFGAEWCPPCKKMEPILVQLKKDVGKTYSLVKVDGGNDISVMKALQFVALPTFIVFKDGKEVWRKQGIATLEELKAGIAK